MLFRTFVAKLAIIILLGAATLIVHAQQTDAAIVVGTVSDPANRVITTATVKLIHVTTNAVTVVYTDERGQYRTPPLRIGEYSLTIEAAGFKQFKQQGLVLNIGDIRQLDVALVVGPVSETVTVEIAAPLLQTQDSTVGTLITNRQIKDLPLNGRDYLQLAALSSGTTPVASNGVGVGIGGQAGFQTAYLLDGLDNNNQQISVSHSAQKEIVKPSVDAIQEFKVVTNSYDAEYGRSSAGVVSVALQSGTNQIHGTAYEFLRNEKLDARNYFSTQGAKAPYKRNQFGGAIGGPIIRDKTFFFGDVEFGRIRQTATVTSTLPSATKRSGVFASVIKDPLSGQPFPNNTIPESRIDPIALKVLSYIPAAQSSAAKNNFVYNSPESSNPHSWDFRIDHSLSAKQNVYFRFSSQQKDDGVLATLPPNSDGYYAGTGGQRTDSKSFAVVYNRIWSPNVVSTIHAGWNYLFWVNGFPQQSLTGVGIPGVSETNPGFSNIVITGYQSTTTALTSPQYWGITNIPNSDGSQNRQLSGDVSWNKGLHSLKFGVQAYWLQTNFLSSQRSGGIFNFNGQYTGDPFADFLLGYVSSTSLSKWSRLNFRIPETHFFVQDSWKASSRLTLSVGLRYELTPPAVEKFDRIANFDLDADPEHPQLVQAGSEGTDRAPRALQGVNYHQFAPRFGFAYRLNNRTVLRGGYGIFYSNFITWGGQQSLEVNPPNALRVNFTGNSSTPSILLRNGFPADALSLSNARNVTLISYDRSNAVPTAQQWNLNIQRELPGGVLLEVGYFGNKLDHNWWQKDGNPAPPGAGNINARRQYTSAVVPGTSSAISLADVVRIQKDGYSRYHALQAKVEKRYSKGLTFIASYAYSKAIQLGDNAANSTVQDASNLRAERSVSPQDMRHHLVGSAVYELPFGHGKSIASGTSRVFNALIGGWSLGPIVTVSTGFPLNLTVAGNPSNSSGVDRPNVVGDWHLDNPTPNEWFNTDAFVANSKYTFGNAPRNLIRGPGLFNLDLAAYKAFRIGDRIGLQFRLEAFNATNTPAFGNPNTQVPQFLPDGTGKLVSNNPNFGVISSAGSPRDIQVGLKLTF